MKESRESMIGPLMKSIFLLLFAIAANGSAAAENDETKPAPVAATERVTAGTETKALLLGSSREELYLAFVDAEIARMKGDQAEVLAALERAAALEPDSPYVWTEIATFHLDADNRKDAYKAAVKAVELNPDRAEPHLVLAGIHNRMKKTSDEEAELRKVLKIDPRNMMGLGLLGGMLSQREGDIEAHREAAGIFLTMSFVSPNQMDYYHYLAALNYMKIDEFAKAADVLEKVIEANPYHRQSYYALAEAYEKLKQWEDAIGVYNRIIEFFGKEGVTPLPKDIIYAHRSLGRIYELLGKTDLAEKEIKLVMENSPQDVTTKRQIGIIDYGHGNYDSSIANLSEWVRNAPNDVSAGYFLAQSYLNRSRQKEKMEVGSGKEDRDAAADRFRKILAVEPEHLGALAGLQEVIPPEGATELLVLYDKAIESIRSSTSSFEDSPDLLVKSARMLQQKSAAAEALNLPEVAESALGSAIEQFNSALRKDPKNEDAIEDLIILYYERENWKEVQSLCGKLLEISPTNTWALHSKAVSEIRRNLFREAALDLEKSVSLSEQDARKAPAADYYYLGVAYGMLNDQEKALGAFRRGLEIHPWQIDLVYQLSAILIQQRKYGEAVELLRESTARNPESTELLARLAYALQKDGKNKEAEDILNEGMGKFPNDTALIIRMSSLLDETGRTEEAVASLNKALESDPEREEFYMQIAVIREKEKKLEEVEKIINRLLEKKPDSATALNFLGYTYADMNVKLDEAYEMIRKAVDMEPENAMFLDSLGWVYYRKGEFDKAHESLSKASTLPGGNDPVIMEHLGDVYNSLSRRDEALVWWKKALELAEDNKDALQKKIESVEKGEK